MRRLAAGTYKATGTAKDTYGATGKWTFTLTVKGSKLTQVAPTVGTTTAGQTFTGQLEVKGSHGTVTYAQLTGAQVLTVLPSGEISAPATLAPATYQIIGTVEDSLGDTGTWSFALIVRNVVAPFATRFRAPTPRRLVNETDAHNRSHPSARSWRDGHDRGNSHCRGAGVFVKAVPSAGEGLARHQSVSP